MRTAVVLGAVVTVVAILGLALDRWASAQMLRELSEFGAVNDRVSVGLTAADVRSRRGIPQDVVHGAVLTQRCKEAGGVEQFRYVLEYRGLEERVMNWFGSTRASSTDYVFFVCLDVHEHVLNTENSWITR